MHQPPNRGMVVKLLLGVILRTQIQLRMFKGVFLQKGESTLVREEEWKHLVMTCLLMGLTLIPAQLLVPQENGFWIHGILKSRLQVKIRRILLVVSLVLTTHLPKLLQARS